MNDCYISYGNMNTDALEDYLNSIFPRAIRDEYDLPNVYTTFTMKYLFDGELGMDILSWYGDGNRVVDVIYDQHPVKIYKVQEAVRRNIIDLIAVVDDHPGSEVIKDYISDLEKRMGRRALRVTFTICGQGHILKLHKDFSGKYDNKLHHVIKNGGVSSLVWYDDKFKEIARCNGQPGDLFYFEGDKYYHKFEKPKSERIHLITCFE